MAQGPVPLHSGTKTHLHTTSITSSHLCSSRLSCRKAAGMKEQDLTLTLVVDDCSHSVCSPVTSSRSHGGLCVCVRSGGDQSGKYTGSLQTEQTLWMPSRLISWPDPDSCVNEMVHQRASKGGCLRVCVCECASMCRVPNAARRYRLLLMRLSDILRGRWVRVTQTLLSLSLFI